MLCPTHWDVRMASRNSGRVITWEPDKLTNEAIRFKQKTKIRSEAFPGIKKRRGAV